MWQFCNIKSIRKGEFQYPQSDLIGTQPPPVTYILSASVYCLYLRGRQNHWDSLQSQKILPMRLLQKKDLLPLLSLLSIYFIQYNSFSKVFSLFSFIFMTQSQITCSSPKTHPRCTWILNHKDNFPNYLFMFPFLQLPVSFFLFFYSIVDLHCCVCFRHIAHNDSVMHIYNYIYNYQQLFIHIYISDSFPQVLTKCWV